MWQRLFAAVEDAPSLHVTAFPTASGYPAVPEMDLVRDVRKTVRTLRTAQRLPQGRELDTMVLAVEQDALREALTALEPTLRATCRAREVRIGATAAGGATPVEGRPGLTVTLPFPHPPPPPHG